MRLTIGGVLVVAGLAGSAVYFGMEPARLGQAVSKIRGAANGAMSLVGLYKSGDSTPEAYSPPPPFPGVSAGTSTIETVIPGSTSTSAVAVDNLPNSPASASGYQPAVATSIPVPVAEPTPEPEKPKPVLKKRRTRKRAAVAAPVKKKAVRKPKQAAKVSSAPAKAPAPSSLLMGTYVSLELITGRAVQGVLEGKTATHYVLNVPGLGPLEYPIENVKSIQPAN